MSHRGCSVQTVCAAHQMADCCSHVKTAVHSRLCHVAAQCGFLQVGCASASHKPGSRAVARLTQKGSSSAARVHTGRRQAGIRRRPETRFQ